MINSILVITDENEGDKFSLEKSHEVAKPLKAKLDVVRFLSHLDSEDAFERKQVISDARDGLEQAVSSIFIGDNEVQCHTITTDDIASWVIGFLRGKPADLVIKTGHRTESLFHTPTDWQLIRQLDCPILIANNKKWKSKHVVLTAIDLSTDEIHHKELNEKALQWTALWAKTFNCSVHIIYSIPIAKALLELEVVEREKYVAKKRPAAEKQLAQLLSHYELVDVHTHISAGPPDKTIPHVANELKAELVIMGCVGRQGLSSLLKGNTAEKVLHHLRTDALIVENSGFK